MPELLKLSGQHQLDGQLSYPAGVVPTKVMETARRLGTFSLVAAFILYILFKQSEPVDLEWRGQLLVYSILLGLLGLLLVIRYRPRGKKTSRFSGFKDFLFRSSRDKKRKPQREKRRKTIIAEEAPEEE